LNVYSKGRLILAGGVIVNDKKQILLLLKKSHNHYEMPGGKVNLEECEDSEEPSIEELSKAAEREVYEELGSVELEKLKYFAKIEFTIPDGRKAIGYNFLTKIISGEPKINEPELFSDLNYFDISELEDLNIAPNLRLLLPKLRLLENE